MSSNKKEYKKPKLNTVDLVTEEVLGVGCKFNDSGVHGSLTTACGFPGAACSLDGS